MWKLVEQTTLILTLIMVVLMSWLWVSGFQNLADQMKEQQAFYERTLDCSTDTECMEMYGGDGGPGKW